MTLQQRLSVKLFSNACIYNDVKRASLLEYSESHSTKDFAFVHFKFILGIKNELSASKGHL